MKSRHFLRIIPLIPAALISQSASAGDVINDGAVVAGSPTVTTQVQIDDGKTLEIEEGASVEVGTAHAIIDAVDGTTVTIINHGTIKSTNDPFDAINTQNSTLILENTGIIDGIEDAIQGGDATSIINSGTITGVDEGIVMSGRIENLQNTGTIHGKRDDGVQADSIGYLYNSGSIISEEDDGVLTIDAAGIGTLINTGTISAYDQAIDTDALDYMKNTGTITSRRETVMVDGDAGTIINEGTIESVQSAGIHVGSLDSFINTGRIIARDDGVIADSDDGSGIIGSFYNSGSIIADGDGVEAVSVGLLNNTGSIISETAAIRLDHGTVINSGTLVGDWDPAVIFGANNPGGTASLTNSGMIKHVSGPGGAAIEFRTGGTGFLTLNPGSVIIGTIDLANTSDTLTIGNGLSIANTFIGMPEEINANGAAYAVNGNQVAVADVSGFKALDNAMVDLTSAISRNVQGRLNGAFNALENTNNEDGQNWMAAFGGGTSWKGDGNVIDHSHGYGGALTGVEGTLSTLARLGAFFGAAEGVINIDYNSQTIDVTSIYAGIYGQQMFGKHSLGFAITAGYSSNDSERSVANNTTETGLETATATYGAWFLSPELSINSQISLFNQIVRPSVSARYLGVFVQDYRESGSAGNLSVDDRQAHELIARAQVALPIYQSTKLNIETSLGLQGRLSRGDKNLTGAMIGQSVNVDMTDNREAIQGYLGVDLNGKLAQNATWFVKTEVGSGSNIHLRGESQAGFQIIF